MQKQPYNRTSTAHKHHQNNAIQLHTQTDTQIPAYKLYYLKSLGRYTLALFFVALAIILALIAPETAEGSVFLVIVAICILVSKDKEIKIILKR